MRHPMNPSKTRKQKPIFSSCRSKTGINVLDDQCVYLVMISDSVPLSIRTKIFVNLLTTGRGPLDPSVRLRLRRAALIRRSIIILHLEGKLRNQVEHNSNLMVQAIFSLQYFDV
jgi:predicted TIM-barrel enzyme